AFSADDSFSDFSPKVALGWQNTVNSRFYLSISRGFKPGGFNHAVRSNLDAVSYDSETSTNAEIGWRFNASDGNLQLLSAFYWIDAKDKQIFVGPLGAQLLRNVGDARSYGIEADISWQATEQTNVVFGLNWGRSEFTDATDSFTGESFDDNHLPYAPDAHLNLALSHQVQQSFLPGQLSLYASARYVDELFFNESNSLSQGSYTLVDLAAALATTNGIVVRLFVDNVTDEHYRTSSFLFGPGDVRSTIGEGRVTGVSASVTF
ncbi:MAG: TonB-dependent receptor, partial [Pseudomonadota bacterium]